MCFSADYRPLVFLERPFELTGDVVFGETKVPKQCPKEPRIAFNVSYHLPEYVERVYRALETEDRSCPKEILRLTPPPFSGDCRAERFSPLTTVSGLDAHFKFTKLPSWIDMLLHRLDHAVSAVVPERVHTLNMTDHIDVQARVPQFTNDTEIQINGGAIWFPSRFYHNVKMQHSYTSRIEYGFLSVCSLVHDKLTTFNDRVIRLTEAIRNEYRVRDSFLMTADCSLTPKLAIFVLDDHKGVQIYTGGNYLIYEPAGSGVAATRNGTRDVPPSQTVNINDEQLIDLRNIVYQYPPDDEFYDFRVYIDREGVLVVENQLNGAVVQYGPTGIVNLLLPTVHKGQMCGLCSDRAV
ncbi:AGAP002032-PA-like protein [Anopheles sinensis]|uniref:AGAP002032-PA-like protein n=1 Tax=Anopheles sinensis TaxID=74873 RepID=A0A084VTW3_ANOSI|nr:AGAP002032-PA-like protein [Anopheles sinensis]